MIKLIIKKFIKDYQDVTNKDVRESYQVLAGVAGIICNIFLFAVKLTIGLFINSIAVITDAFNNFTDLGSSLVMIFGAKLSNRPPDEEHPNGHGRFEYIASLIVAAIIFAVGFKLITTSIDKITNPEPVVFNVIAISILIISVSVKLWMFSYNKYIAKVINSSVNRATAYDSINDVIAASGVILSTVIGNFTSFPVDGVAGVIVSAVIVYTGFTIAKDAVNLLLGPAPDPELVTNISSLVLAGKCIRGIHGLRVHDYGPGRLSASIHAEVADCYNITDIHNEVDAIEHKIEDELGIKIVIHMDPVAKAKAANNNDAND